MSEPLPGNLPGRSILWSSEDGRTLIVRYCDGVFGLEHDGLEGQPTGSFVEVMPPGPFKKIQAYLWSEFITDA